MVSGEIDFIEPNDAGVYKKEKFEISDDEVRKLEKTIKRVTDEILNLKFWNTRCADPHCPWCSLRSMMK